MSDDFTGYDVSTISFTQANNASPPQIGAYANRMTINMPTGFDLSDSEIALQSLNCYYSWFNIQAALNNNVLQYLLPNTGGGNMWGTTPVNVYTNPSNVLAIGDGIYSIMDLNNALAFTFTSYGHYFIDNNGNNVYPITFAVNPTAYGVTVTLNQLYNVASFPTGWTYPPATAGASRFTSATFLFNCYAAFIVPTGAVAAGSYTPGQSSMSKVLGFAPGSYPNIAVFTNPSALTVTSFQSQFVPQVNTINSVGVACSLVNASKISPLSGSVIYTFSPTVQSGQQVFVTPSQYTWLPVTPGLYSQVTLYLLTDAFTPLPIVDPAVSATLLVRSKKVVKALPAPSNSVYSSSSSYPSSKRTRPEITGFLGDN